MNNNIKFETQKRFSITGIETRFFDFFLQEYNCVLEVHGSQHYQEKFLHKSEELIERVRIDVLKRNAIIFAGYKYIEVPYFAINQSDKVIKAIKKPFYPYALALQEFEKSAQMRNTNFHFVIENGSTTEFTDRSRVMMIERKLYGM